MPLKESEAIILRSYPLGEGDRLVSFLDRKFGRLRGVARGARLTKSRFGSTLELLSHVKIWYFEKETREIVRINQCELIESFLEVQKDYQAGVCLALISEVTEAVLGEREAAAAQFRLTLLAARATKEKGASPVVLAYFCLWTARLGGWLGPLDRCARCSRTVQKEDLFASPGHAELHCLNCLETGMRKISNAALSVGREALSGTLDRLFNLEPSSTGAREILSFSLYILEQHIEKKLLSRNLLESEEIG
jgi:DNA repair protein RecO (recombination protein O)